MNFLKCKTWYTSLHSCFGLILLLGITFTSVTTAQSNSTAQLTIEGVSYSSSIGKKSFIVTKYADEACSKHGKTHKVFKKKYAKDVHTFKPLVVDANQPFVFQVSYIEERRSEIKRCASIASVDLTENGKYKAVFSIVDEVLGCNIKLYDLDPDAVAEANDVLAPSSDSNEVAMGEATTESQTVAQVEVESDETNTAQQDSALTPSVTDSPVEIDFKKPAETCDKVGETGYKNGTPVYTYKDRFG